MQTSLQSLLLPVGKDGNFLKLLCALCSDHYERSIRVFLKNEYLLYTKHPADKERTVFTQSYAALSLPKIGNP